MVSDIDRGGWNEAIDLAAHVADVQATDAGNAQWEMAASQIAKDIRSLRRPDAAPATPSPQPPAPAEGGTDVRELLNRLNMWLDNDYVRRCPDYIKSRSLDHAIGGAFDALIALTAALAAKEAEIARLNSREPLANVKLSEENDALIERIAALEAALRPFALRAESLTPLPSVDDYRRARAALTQKGPTR